MKATWVLFLTMVGLGHFPVSAQDSRKDVAKPVERAAPVRPAPAAPARTERAPQPPPRNNPVSAPEPARIDLSHQTFRNNIGNPEPNRTTRWNVPVNPQPQAQPQNNLPAFSRPGAVVDNNRPARTFQRLSPSRFVSVQPT